MITPENTSEPETLDLFIDLETLGTKPGCGLLQCAILRVWPVSGCRDTVPFLVSFDRSAMVDAGFTECPDTRAWWNEQDQAVRQAVFSGTTLPPEGAARILSEIKKTPFRNIWCRGASFDFPILEAFLGRYFQYPAWEYSQERCFRTLQNQIDPEKRLRPARQAGAMKHHAGDDVIADAMWLINITRHLSQLAWSDAA